MKLALLLSLLLAGSVASISLENVTINGSAYYWAYVNDSNGNPYVLINASSGNAQWSTSETDNITDALSRQLWLKYSLGFGRLATNNTILGVLTLGMDSFNTYGFNDSNGWRTESNKSTTFAGGRSVVMRLKHERKDYDPLVNLTVRYELGGLSYISLVDIWFFLKIQNITHFDKLNIYQGSKIYDVSIFGSKNFTNVSRVILHGNQSPPSWDYLFEDSENNAVFVKDGGVWLGYNLGRTLPASSSFQRSWKSIDAICSITCEDDVVIVTTTDTLDAGQIINTANNHTIGVKWSDLSGTCYYSGTNCALNIGIRDPYKAATTCEIVTNSISNWISCTMTNPNHHCELSYGTYYASISNPVKNIQYYLNFTNNGRYSSMSNDSHKMVGTLGNFQIVTNVCGPSQANSFEVVGTDTSNGTISCTFNGVPIANNSVNSIFTTNGSLAYVNLTVNCTFNDPARPYTSWTGMYNNSFISLNQSGWEAGLNITAQSAADDNYFGKQGITYLTVNNSYAYKICAGFNQTNLAGSGVGQVGSNWTRNWCYIVTRFEIVPYPVTEASFLKYFQFLSEDEDDGWSLDWYWWFLGILAVAFVVWRGMPSVRQQDQEPE